MYYSFGHIIQVEILFFAIYAMNFKKGAIRNRKSKESHYNG